MPFTSYQITKVVPLICGPSVYSRNCENCVCKWEQKSMKQGYCKCFQNVWKASECDSIYVYKAQIDRKKAYKIYKLEGAFAL